MPQNRRQFLGTVGPLLPLTVTKPGAIYDLVGEKPKPRPGGRLALVVGHTRLRPGAFGIGSINSYEYPFNRKLSRLITQKAEARGVLARTFYRDIGGVSRAYTSATDWGADAVIELHFNSTSKRIDTVQGTETLSAGGQRLASYRLALSLHRTSLQALARPALLDRGVKPCRLRTDYAVPAILTEPVFGNNLADARLLTRRADAYADSVVDGFLGFQKVKDRPLRARPIPRDVTHLPADLEA